MTFYQEIALHSCSEINLYFLWQKVYQQIHLGLANCKTSENESVIGISFPEYYYYNDEHQTEKKNGLGRVLRLFSNDETDLFNFNCCGWLSRLEDYLSVSEIKPVPEKIKGYACFMSVKPKGSKEKLARRMANRKSITVEEALQHFGDYQQKINERFPYIHMRSQSTNHKFSLFIKKLEVAQPKVGMYSCYGLSTNSTVPIF